jgi:hypothetical protein
MTLVPQAWTDLQARLVEAMVARDVMRSPESTQQVRDVATVNYTHASDAVIDLLAQMRGDGTLPSLTLLLARKDRLVRT